MENFLSNNIYFIEKDKATEGGWTLNHHPCQQATKCKQKMVYGGRIESKVCNCVGFWFWLLNLSSLPNSNGQVSFFHLHAVFLDKIAIIIVFRTQIITANIREIYPKMRNIVNLNQNKIQIPKFFVFLSS